MITNKIRLIELFGGVGCQSIALRDLAIANGLNPDDVFEHHRLVEFDKFPVKSYNAIHATDFVPMDIQDIHGEDIDVEEPDKYTAIWTYSFPCLSGDSLVLTKNGYKPIKDINVGDEVLSHDNNYHKIIAHALTKKDAETVKVKGMGFDAIECTPNHKFLVRERITRQQKINGHRHNVHTFTEPEYVEAKNLHKGHFIGFAINNNADMPKWNGYKYKHGFWKEYKIANKISSIINNHDFWWLIGRYLGDGWYTKDESSVFISVKTEQLTDVTNVLDKLDYKYSIYEEGRPAQKVSISNKELVMFLKPFGKGAYNKCLPGFVYDMPTEYLKDIIKGYESADGYIDNRNRRKASSVSKQLIYGMCQIVAKAYHRPYSVMNQRRDFEVIIDDKKASCHGTYTYEWREYEVTQEHAYFRDGKLWMPFRELQPNNNVDVYDIEVEDSHSFIVNGAIVHNCQDLSVAGKQLGMDEDSGTRSSLLWQVKRLLNEVPNLPDILIMENVTQVHSKKNLHNFEEWCQFLESKGYHNYWSDLEASEYGVPQHRNRCFMVSSLEEIDFEFPRPIQLHEVMKDRLDPVVDEKFYINNEKADALIKQLIADGKLDEETILEAVDLSVNNPSTLDIANCVSARTDRGISNRRSEGSGVVQC